MSQIEEINSYINELNKFVHVNFDQEKQQAVTTPSTALSIATSSTEIISKEKAWSILIKAEQLVNSMQITDEEETNQQNENELSWEFLNKTKITETQNELDQLNNLHKLYRMESTSVIDNERLHFIGIGHLLDYMNDLFSNLIEHYFNFQYLFPFNSQSNKKHEEQKPTKTFSIKNTLVYGLKGTGLKTLINSVIEKYQSLFETNTLGQANERPLKVFRLDFAQLITTAASNNQLELIFKSIHLSNTNKQPLVFILLNLEVLFSDTLTQLKLHMIGDLLNECFSQSNRCFIAISYSPWDLHPALVYRFEKIIYCPELNSSQKKHLIETHLISKYNQKLNLTKQLLELTESFVVNNGLIKNMFEHLKPYLLAASAAATAASTAANTGTNKSWKMLRIQLDVLKRFKKYKHIKSSCSNNVQHLEQELARHKEFCLAEAKLYLEANQIDKNLIDKFIMFKNEYRGQLDFP